MVTQNAQSVANSIMAEAIENWLNSRSYNDKYVHSAFPYPVDKVGFISKENIDITNAIRVIISPWITKTATFEEWCEAVDIIFQNKLCKCGHRHGISIHRYCSQSECTCDDYQLEELVARGQVLPVAEEV